MNIYLKSVNGYSIEININDYNIDLKEIKMKILENLINDEFVNKYDNIFIDIIDHEILTNDLKNKNLNNEYIFNYHETEKIFNEYKLLQKSYCSLKEDNKQKTQHIEKKYDTLEMINDNHLDFIERSLYSKNYYLDGSPKHTKSYYCIGCSGYKNLCSEEYVKYIHCHHNFICICKNCYDSGICAEYINDMIEQGTFYRYSFNDIEEVEN